MLRLLLVLAATVLCIPAHAAKEPARKATANPPVATAVVPPPSGPANDASIRELIAIHRFAEDVAEAHQHLEKELQQATSTKTDPYGLALNPPQKAVIEKCKTSMLAFLRKELVWPKLEQEYIRFYREHYTQEQIETILAFLKSPTGTAYRATEDSLSRKMETTFIKPIQEKAMLYLVAMVTDLQNCSDYVRPDQREE